MLALPGGGAQYQHTQYQGVAALSVPLRRRVHCAQNITSFMEGIEVGFDKISWCGGEGSCDAAPLAGACMHVLACYEWIFATLDVACVECLTLMHARTRDAG